MRVAMTLAHPWRNDSRVIREAEALAEAGHEVRIFCRGPDGCEVRGGVTYVAIPDSDKERFRRWLRLGIAHVSIALRWHRDRFAIGTGCGLRSLVGAVREGLRFLPIAAHAAASARYRESAPARRHAEPFFHLNDYAVACTAAIVAWKPDVVHVHDLACLSGGYLAARRLRAPFVFDAHELETHVNYRINRLTRFFRARYERVLIREAAAVITVSESIADWLAAKYAIPRPIVVHNVPTGAAPDRGGGETVRRRLGLEPAETVVVYVGTMNDNRGLEHCAEALRFAPGIHFAIVGRRHAELESRLRALAADHGVGERLHFVDPVPSDEVVSFIRDADGSVLPIQKACLSFHYCMPNKLFESVLAGLPLMLARLAELRAFREEFGLGLEIDETAPRSIAAAMVEIARDPQRHRPTVDQRRRILERYGWPVQKARLLRLYATLGRGAGNGR